MSINFTLSEEQEMIKESAHEFAMQVIRPAAVHHDQTGEYPGKSSHKLGNKD